MKVVKKNKPDLLLGILDQLQKALADCGVDKNAKGSLCIGNSVFCMKKDGRLYYRLPPECFGEIKGLKLHGLRMGQRAIKNWFSPSKEAVFSTHLKLAKIAVASL